MSAEWQQITWDQACESAWRELLRMAVREDLGRGYDWTTVLLVPDDALGRATMVARREGVVAGLPAARMALAEYDASAEWTPLADDGARVQAGQPVARLAGKARSLLTAERVLLNAVGRLSGIATLTRKFVDAVAGTAVRIYDTRKTLPGWRRLDKYAVRAGGGWNHRVGLYDAILIKDNHLALGAAELGGRRYSAAEAVARSRAFVAEMAARENKDRLVVEVEVDSLDQLEAVLPAEPDIVLLDNMSVPQLAKAVARRNAVNRRVLLEASGGIGLDHAGEIARTGVDRISIGALTHSAAALDVALDWEC